MKLSEEKVFKDPIHKYIYVYDNVVWEAINTKAFQRLRRIKQLGTTYFTFHGAEHSRFGHSLGVYEITRRIISQFERNEYEEWSKEERILALLSALLHDIGHGPFSHTIESVINHRHEEWTKKIILGNSDLNQVLVNYDPQLPTKIVNIIGKKGEYPIIESIISSQLDADRMDYLLRDAYYTGVNYGNFDLERVLRVLRPFNNKIAVKESGMHSIEDYLVARYQMYRQIYFHPVTRSGDIILRKIFQRAKQLYFNGYKFKILFQPIERLFKGELDIEDYLALDDSLINTTFYLWSSESDNILADLTSRFLNRKLFHYIDFEPSNNTHQYIYELLTANGFDPEYYLEIDSPADSPYDTYNIGKGRDKTPIILLNENGETNEISNISEIISAIMGKRVSKSRIYYPREILDEGLKL